MLWSGEVEQSEISAVVREHFPEGADGGLALLVVSNGEVIHSKGYGLKNGKEPITPTTPMPTASVAKQYAAMCAAVLMDEGKLAMSDKVADHLPEVKLARDGRELLIQDLVWHIGGLPNFLNSKEKASIAEYRERHGLERLNNQTHAAWLATMPLLRSPGIEFEYTNSGYVLLARVVEVIAGKPYAEFQRERIHEALNFAGTRTITSFNGSGNMETTLEDYVKWDRALWETTLLGGDRAQMLFQSGTLDNGEPVGYGFGWNVESDEQGVKEVWHRGRQSAIECAQHDFAGHAPSDHRRVVRSREPGIQFGAEEAFCHRSPRLRARHGALTPRRASAEDEMPPQYRGVENGETPRMVGNETDPLPLGLFGSCDDHSAERRRRSIVGIGQPSEHSFQW
tara:strand:- start:555 stop:1742 length:1188 start_codon:yes stop_codon:yes gene_type:complete